MIATSFSAQVPAGYTLVLGLGTSGQAVIRNLRQQNIPFMLADTRQNLTNWPQIQALAPKAPFYLGPLEQLDMRHAHEVIISPGLDPALPALKAQHIHAIGEIELFCRQRPKEVPLIAITGSNAKSTVTTWVGEMARLSGINALVGGNLGTPALDLLNQNAAVFVLELSSFQLETTTQLNADIACFLNLSEDHLDRHHSMEAYLRSKQQIFNGARWAVTNADDPATWAINAIPQVRFSLQPKQQSDWHIADEKGKSWLAYNKELWLPTDELQLAGQHNLANALASMAVAQLMHWPATAILQALRTFRGLKHRCEVIATLQGVRYINDSKGTNVAASLAAIEGIGSEGGKLIWLGGGLGKDADFTPLAKPLARYARAVLLFGRDAMKIKNSLSDESICEIVPDLTTALERAQQLAKPGDSVLLSPACASFDQFANFQARGEAFRQWVLNALPAMPPI